MYVIGKNMYCRSNMVMG